MNIDLKINTLTIWIDILMLKLFVFTGMNYRKTFSTIAPQQHHNNSHCEQSLLQTNL